MKIISLICMVSVFVANSFAQTVIPSSDVVMKAAYAKAAKQNKTVLLIFHASWCGWCKKMDSSLLDTKYIFDKNFVIEHLTVQESKGKEYLENPGAEALMNTYNGEKQGLPYWVMLDKEGKFLFDSQIRKEQADGRIIGANVGCPASKEEVDYFIGLLKKLTTLDGDDLGIIEDRFRKNEAKQ
jgi:thiol-disulfide isomerase/thioredoxin